MTLSHYNAIPPLGGSDISPAPKGANKGGAYVPVSGAGCTVKDGYFSNDTPAPTHGKQDRDGVHTEWNEGMSLRDYFAGQAIAASYKANLNPADLAAAAYEIADAMIAERGQ